MYEAIIFDFDGVIINSEPIHFQACLEVLHSIDLELTYSEYFEKYAGLSDHQMFPLILADKEKAQLFEQEEIAALICKKVAAYKSIIDRSEKFPIINGLYDYLEVQNKKVSKFAICTGSSKPEVTAVVKKLNNKILLSCVSMMVTVEDIQHGKPSPEGYLLTASRLKVPPSKCLAIEDSSHGIKAAKTAGMQVIALATTANKNQLKGADKIVADFAALL